MNEGAIDEENPIIAKFEIQANENTKLFVTNKCPINLKGNKYIKLKYHLVEENLVVIYLNLPKLINYSILILLL